MNIKKTKLSLSKLNPIAIVILSLFIAGFFSFVLSKTIQQGSIKLSESVKTKTAKKIQITLSPTEEVQVSNISQNKSTQSLNSNPISEKPTEVPKPTYTTVSTTTNNAQSNPQTNTNAVEKKVNLSVNGGSGLEIKIPDGANQCDVLSSALQQGRIQSLNMRFDNSLGSNAVYQINGVGKENSVWWTYKVNGQAPSQGCSFVKANNGDNIDWKYIGS